MPNTDENNDVIHNPGPALAQISEQSFRGVDRNYGAYLKQYIAKHPEIYKHNI